MDGCLIKAGKTSFHGHFNQQGYNSVYDILLALLKGTDVEDETLHHLITAVINALNNIVESS